MRLRNYNPISRDIVPIDQVTMYLQFQCITATATEVLHYWSGTVNVRHIFLFFEDVWCFVLHEHPLSYHGTRNGLHSVAIGGPRARVFKLQRTILIQASSVYFFPEQLEASPEQAKYKEAYLACWKFHLYPDWISMRSKVVLASLLSVPLVSSLFLGPTSSLNVVNANIMPDGFNRSYVVFVICSRICVLLFSRSVVVNGVYPAPLIKATTVGVHS